MGYWMDGWLNELTNKRKTEELTDRQDAWRMYVVLLDVSMDFCMGYVNDGQKPSQSYITDTFKNKHTPVEYPNSSQYNYYAIDESTDVQVIFLYDYLIFLFPLQMFPFHW